MHDSMRRLHRRSKADAATQSRWFFRVVLPLGALANLGLGVLLVSNLHPVGWPGWLQLAIGAFCCVIAGWLGSAAWARTYWNDALVKQVTIWRRISDAIFGWLEDAPVPPEALTGLMRSLDEVVPER